jgi:hypothetical protein
MAEGEIDAENAARLVLMTDRHLRRLVEDGWVKKSPTGKYTLIGTVQGVLRYKDDQISRLSKKTQGAHALDARARMIELNIAEKSKNLCSVEELRDTVDYVVGQLKYELTGVPSGSTRDKEVRAKIEHGIETALTRAADRLEQAMGDIKAGREIGSPIAEDDPG